MAVLLTLTPHLAYPAGVAAKLSTRRPTGFRLAICMVGQVARTEVTSKIENLIKANARNSYVHMFLILQAGEARFTNKASSNCQIAPSTIEQVHGMFSRYAPTTSTVFEYINYGVDWKKWPGYPEERQKKTKRLTNHINQFLSWRTCAREVAKEEVKSGEFFTAVLRVRDNALVLEPFNVMERLVYLQAQTRQAGAQPFQPPGNPREQRLPVSGQRTRRIRYGDDIVNLPVLTKKCCSWRGVNDKVG